MTIYQIQKEGIEKLQKAQVEEAMLKAKLLLAYVLEKSKEYLIIHSEEEVLPEQEKTFWKGIKQLEEKLPLAYITHHKEFMGLDFYVDENVLIPRPDTEILIETVLKKCSEIKTRKILDLCTGSGAIAISIAKYLAQSEVSGIDISPKAIEVAKRNAKQNGVPVSFWQSDLWEEIEGEWDVIVSNPPYIETEVIATLQEEVQKEPVIALDGGRDGLDFYRIIIAGATKYLNPGGILAVEIGYQQAEKVKKLFEDEKCYDTIEVKKDLAGNDRVVIAKKLTCVPNGTK